MAFDNIVDAKRVLSVLGKRLARYGLTLHPDKTRLVDFRPKRAEGARHPEADGTSFDFLGLTHVWGRSRNGKDMVRQVTAPKAGLLRAVAAVNDWCRRNRHWSLHDQHRHLSSMMRGHLPPTTALAATVDACVGSPIKWCEVLAQVVVSA